MRAVCLSLLLAAALTLGSVPTLTNAQDAPAAADNTAAEPAVLIADRVSVMPDGTLVAEGSVEAFQGRIKLSARRITFNRTSGQLTIDGPIRLTEGADTTIVATRAELDPELQNGLIKGARMVLNQQVQLSAHTLDRRGDRYTQLYRASATSCRICEEGEAPLWQIRARSVIHDRQEKQLYFEDAHLRIGDVPVFYLPRLRLPDPTLDRASGFLVPSIRTTSQLNTGVKIPYFFKLGDHADLTVTPYLSASTRTLELRYRHAFTRGRIAFEGAYTRDDLIQGVSRGYVFGSGAFALDRGYQLRFDVEWASDNAYLVDYGLPDLDRLRSEVALTRPQRDQFMRIGLTNFQSLRDGEIEDQLPTLVGDVIYDRRYHPSLIGGEVNLGLEAHSHRRRSDLDVLGRDVLRLSAELDWRRSWTLSSGLRLDWRMGAAADVFDINQDSGFPGTRSRWTPHAALKLSLPLMRQTGAVTQVIEPIVQVGWTQLSGDTIPNEESGRVEFDQGNLFALSRFPAADTREDGLALAYGVNWRRYGPGWQSALTLGQVVRDAEQLGFSSTSGLSGGVSDFLLAGQLKSDFGFDLTARTIFDDGFDVAKASVRGGWANARSSLGGTYIWLQSDLAEGRTQAVSEFNLDGSHALTEFWTASANWRYDLADTRAATAGLGLTYQNECVVVDLSLNRRYASSTSVEPTTDFGFTISLRGFSAMSGTERQTRSCKS